MRAKDSSLPLTGHSTQESRTYTSPRNTVKLALMAKAQVSQPREFKSGERAVLAPHRLQHSAVVSGGMGVGELTWEHESRTDDPVSC